VRYSSLAAAIRRLPATQPVEVLPAVPTTAQLKQRSPRHLLPVVNGNAPSFSIIGLLDRYLSSVDVSVPKNVNVKFRGPRSDGVFHASGVSKEGVCLREQAYGIYQAPKAQEVVDARMRRVFDNGHFTHARLEDNLIDCIKFYGGQAWNEMHMDADAKLRTGTPDLGLILNGWPYFIEIKSIKKGGPFGFGLLGGEPQPDHKRQLNQYMGLSHVRAGWVLYECKEDQEMLEYFIRYDHDMFMQIEREVVDPVLAHVRAGTLPDKITDAEGCYGEDRCGYYEICKRRGGQKWLPAPKEV
jgi:hypothetical protein